MMQRPWSGLRARMVFTYLAIFLLTAAIIVIRSGTLYAISTSSSAQGSLEVDAYTVSSALGRLGIWSNAGDQEDNPTITLPQLQDVTGGFANQPNSNIQINIVDVSGYVQATSLPVTWPNQRNAPEVIAALGGGAGSAVRWDPALNQETIYAAVPIQRGNRIFGVVQLAEPATSLVSQVRAYWLSLGLTALMAALVAALAGLLLANEIVRPVRRLRDAAIRLADGNLDERVPVGDFEGVAEIGQLAGAFNHMAGRLADMIERQRYFVASASHELRTPLTNIKLRAEALGNGALEDPSVAHRFVSEIESEANRLGRMAADLLTLSRQDSAAAVYREPIDPAVLVAETNQELAMRAEKVGVRLVQDVTPGLPLLIADPVGLRTVLVNLLDNALQYTGPGGTVTTRARARNRALVLQVTDTGLGISEEDLPRIFERFYRADKARSRRNAQRSAGISSGSGAGLGLAIVRGIVEEHGGSVTADSTPGQGTTITVMLPLEPAGSGPDLQLPARSEALTESPSSAV
jgi:signal transduction histidine kinase